MGIEALEAKAGEPVAPKWRMLTDWIRRQQVQAPGARVTYGQGGAQVIFDATEYSQNVRFRVSLSGNKKVTVGAGTINGKVPEVGGVPITGRDNPPAPPPQIPIAAPDVDGVALICLKVSFKADGNVDTVTVESKTPEDIPGGLRADRSVGTEGFVPIALVRHNLQTREPESVFQHSVHNLQVRMYDSDQGRRVIYWPA
jgi:hypothetical protein